MCVTNLWILVIILLGVWSPEITASASVALKTHVDYTQNPPLRQSCIKADCECGTQPRICDIEGRSATCDPCPSGTFQPDSISSVEIIDARQCRAHTKCTKVGMSLFTLSSSHVHTQHTTILQLFSLILFVQLYCGCYASVVYAVVVCLSVCVCVYVCLSICPSHANIVLKWLNIGLCKNAT